MLASHREALQIIAMARPPRIPNWLPWEQRTICFVTFCVAARKRVLADEPIWQLCLTSLHRLDKWTLLAALAMPHHLHLLVAPADREASVGELAKWFKCWFKQALLDANWQWQEGCFDRLLRSDESLGEKWDYVRENPLRAGLVKDAADWPYQYAFNSEHSKL